MEKLPKIKSPEDYTPSEDEEYMSVKQLEYFSLKLQSILAELEKQELEDNSIDTYYSDEDSGNEELIKRRKDRKEKIKEALEKIKLGTYGYCDGTGEEIGVERLKANPLAIYCIEEQERVEKEKNVYNIND
ncbi:MULTISPECIES: TraR/DksA family transcriptional regulator [Wolbachia]|jgi:DnaK suppressor protein|uniref:TraR/DksA family transcriptional regulator n=1 Tax=Wolbachia pipientis TaxID=955 RepID=A0A6I6CJ22_WOLPI|nr:MULTISPECIES: TraR/DksA C4-type zinc finger protein [Wolbachia]MDE5063009.1 TraR/DksA C4-type zinc finger protein [Wolbachia endosymbiont of Drosophila chauvacae]MDX5496501.1 TraR/DksA C4-type zinc finger protein [Wolbachia endosymbiont of Nomada fabriciana]MDX5508105.1 TraR/DksA C4-type zinc finger protein [Wolbachia endosymbiont of Hylaeus sinuatus]MDX5518751.1 TraR/DksA C4-type zinc finger protein [Wolbachia endosymbiont of Andrena agilissima]MDX5526484.1 TraR/DksA C4-type zinc finger pr